MTLIIRIISHIFLHLQRCLFKLIRMKPQIDLDLLLSFGAVFKECEKGEILFSEGDKAYNYYQVVSGSVKMFNTNDDGKEFTQGYFSAGQSFGEPPLFIDERYPASAMAFQLSEVVKLSKDKFLDRKSTRLNSSHVRISYAVFCLKKKKKKKIIVKIQ